jgi:hypothetical protein
MPDLSTVPLNPSGDVPCVSPPAAAVCFVPGPSIDPWLSSLSTWVQAILTGFVPWADVPADSRTTVQERPETRRPGDGPPTASF